MLLSWNDSLAQPQLVSKGYLQDTNCLKREPPFQAILTNNAKAIVLMLYENALKVMPINRKPMQLGNAFNVRLMHPQVMKIFQIKD